MKLTTKFIALAASAVMAFAAPAMAEDWAPDGPLTIQIGFGAVNRGIRGQLQLRQQVRRGQAHCRLVNKNFVGWAGVHYKALGTVRLGYREQADLA